MPEPTRTVMGLKKDVSVRTWLRADGPSASALRQGFANFVLKKGNPVIICEAHSVRRIRDSSGLDISAYMSGLVR
jgi:hypothetical protein